MKHGNVKRGFHKDDLSFELKDKGKRNAQRVGIWLEKNNLIPDCLICSTAEYARVTAEKTCKAASLSLNNIQVQECSHAANNEEIINLIKASPEKSNCLLLVGHNPALDLVLSFLSRENIPKTKKGKVLTPAALVHFNIDCAWSEISDQCAELKEIVYPKTLPDLFPYPDLNGNEKRIRPAYYYKQSCVIPYRIENDQLQVLIISSSMNKHWVVPKGIHEPGLTAQESASKEAHEEAGVKGVVRQKEVACYEYDKWEATCTVAVFLMKVTDILNEEQWQESRRRRRWVTVSEAVKLIHNPQLANIVASVPDVLEQQTA
jgi:phosphohistidine phosphatase